MNAILITLNLNFHFAIIFSHKHKKCRTRDNNIIGLRGEAWTFDLLVGGYTVVAV